MKTYSYAQDIKMTNALKKARREKGLQSPRNPVSWVEAYLSALVIYAPSSLKTSVTTNEIKIALKDVNLEYNVSGATFFALCIEQVQPTNAREYSQLLPVLVRSMGMEYDTKLNDATARWEYCFWFKNPRNAQKVLVNTWPQVKDFVEFLKKS